MTDDARAPVVVLDTEATEPSITCNACGSRSYHPDDVLNTYCGRCHKTHAHVTDFVITLPIPKSARDKRLPPR